MDFNLLPLEMKFHIFSFLTEDELRRNVATVCKEWRTLAKDPYLKTNFTINKQKSPEIVKLLKKYWNIQHLEITGVNNWDWINEMPTINTLRKLTLTNCSFYSDDTISRLIARVPYIRNLQVLCSWNSTTKCFSRIPVLKYLKSIRLNFNHDDTQHCTCADEFLENCNNVNDIYIASPPQTERSFIKMVDSSASTLSKLRSDCRNLTDVAYQSLTKCRRLDHLSIDSTNNLSIVGLTHIQELTQLRHLSIIECDEDFIQFFERSEFPRLTYLCIHSKNLRDKTLQLIAQSCPFLRHLELERSRLVSDCGVMSIIKRCSSLEELNLIGMFFLRGTFLKQILTRLPNLIRLDLNGSSKIQFCCFASMRQKKRTLTVVAPDGKEVPYDGIDYEYLCCSPCFVNRK